MQFIKHRVNKIQELATVNSAWGIELDLRSNVTKSASLHLSHDPYVLGDDFELWLVELKKIKISGPLFLNTKEDGLEAVILEKIKKVSISNELVFLDTALPTLVRSTMKEKLSCFAARVSQYEPLEFILKFSGKAKWAWVDCFDRTPLDVQVAKELKKHFKVCLVSPELQGESMPLSQEIKAQFQGLVSLADAICTKNPNMWL